MDVVIEGYEQRSPFIAGSSEEVEFVMTALKTEGANIKSLEEQAEELMKIMTQQQDN